MILTSRLVLKEREDRIALTMPRGFKIFLMGIGLLILLSIITTTPGGLGGLFTSRNILPLALSAFSLLAAGYHECWNFDRSQDRLVYQVGFLRFHSNRVIKISDLQRVELAQFIKGSLSGQSHTKRRLFQRTMVMLSILDKSGGVHRLEIYSGPHVERIQETARRIADYCGIPLVNELSDA